MNGEHWFDLRHRELVRQGSRRAALRTLAALAGGLAHVRTPPAAAAAAAPCARHQCQRAFRTRRDRAWCEFVCRQCDGADPRQFCIVEGRKPNGKPTKVARCCPDGKVCCGDACIGSKKHPEIRCCANTYVDTNRHPDHCGGCGKSCPPGKVCVDGRCVCPDGKASCGKQCCEDGWSCFENGTKAECCPSDYIRPQCLSAPPNPVCIPDVSQVCCDGFSCYVGDRDPKDYVCCGRGDRNAGCAPSQVSCPGSYERYPPLSTYTYGQG